MSDINIITIDSDNESNESWRTDRTFDAVIPKQRSNLAERWLKLLKSGDWSDCSFQVGQPEVNQQKFECHALVLASCSPVFEAMLLGPMAEKKFPILIPDISPATFSLLINFAYTGKVNDCNFTQALEVCMAADKYQVEGVLDVCVDLLCEGLNLENVCKAFQLADQHNIKKLKDFCIRMLQDNTAQIISSTSFKECSSDLVVLLLQQDQVCANEQQLINAVMEWAANFLEEESTEDEANKPSTETEESEISLPSESKPCSSLPIEPKPCSSLPIEPKPCSSQEVKSVRDSETAKKGGHNLRKRQCKTSRCGRKMKVQKQNQEPLPSYTEKEKTKGLQLRTIVGPALQYMRFLSPSLNFSEFLKTFPCVLLPEEVAAILKTRQAFEKASKGIKYGPWDSETYYSKLPEKTKALETLVQKQNKKPLPNSLYNRFDERYAPYKSCYKNNKGDDIEFKFSPLTLSNRGSYEYCNSLTGCFQIETNQTIVCHGIQLPSQVSLDSFSSSTEMYREMIYIDAKFPTGGLSSGSPDYSHVEQGKILFNELVPYNSTITVMFPKPFEITRDSGLLLEISYHKPGNYPCENTKTVVTTGEVSIKISDAYMYPLSSRFIRGLIFESRSKDNMKFIDTWEGFHGPDLDLDEDWTSYDDHSNDDSSDGSFNMGRQILINF